MLRQSSYIFVSKVIGYGIRILLPAFLVRVLTKADFGSYNQFFLIEVLFQTIFQMGVNQSQFFFVPKDPKNAGNRCSPGEGLKVVSQCRLVEFGASVWTTTPSSNSSIFDVFSSLSSTVTSTFTLSMGSSRMSPITAPLIQNDKTQLRSSVE